MLEVRGATARDRRAISTALATAFAADPVVPCLVPKAGRDVQMFEPLPLTCMPLPACTGTWQQITLTVVPFAATFTSGQAMISVFLGAFDQVQGDLEARDSASVRLGL